MKHVHGFTTLASAALMLMLASSPVLAKDSPSKDKPEVQYPNATRVAPKLDLTSEKDQKNLNAGLDAVSANDKAKALQYLQPIVDGSKSKYAQALALQGLATIKYQVDNDPKGAIALLQQSLANGVMPNDTYFQLEYMLAQFQVADEEYQPALDTITKWRAEGKKETANSYALEGNVDYRLGKFPEAITAIKKAQSLTDKPEASWNQILMASYSQSGQGDQAAQVAQQQLAANPNDPNALDNAVAVLMQANKNDEAIQVMERARASGTLKTEANYTNLAKLYLIRAQSSSTDSKPDASKSAQVLEEGMSKSIVTSSAENYLLLGEADELSDNTNGAVDAYTKAMPTAKDGEAAIRGGQILLSEQKYSQAKSMIQQGIDKGVKQKGSAYMLLANSEIGLKDKPAAIAAMKQAAQDPQTADKAKAWLKKAGAGK
ncbi:tetratricopeptide repeat protein [Rhodanobacter sp. MP1X3]|uniref:tetratricopeptide repeat protein n=1 Tax=Rhodanobacter sp. MP1X3 TaxID=2723086 RepID=UPI00160F1D58|nr:tetratricopeptide repeat protein [Rhodanobacter sp. MP1X3]MBB6240681.1 putative Zn-dependent protease [Rhodanobacter sp. MP1X3]